MVRISKDLLNSVFNKIGSPQNYSPGISTLKLIFLFVGESAALFFFYIPSIIDRIEDKLEPSTLEFVSKELYNIAFIGHLLWGSFLFLAMWVLIRRTWALEQIYKEFKKREKENEK